MKFPTSLTFPFPHRIHLLPLLPKSTKKQIKKLESLFADRQIPKPNSFIVPDEWDEPVAACCCLQSVPLQRASERSRLLLDGRDPRAILAGRCLHSDLYFHMMENSQIWWKQERSNMMTVELVDLVETTKLLVFMCLDSSSPWGEMEPSRARIHHTTLLPS